jgi:aldehyde dehydrogenase (NAD+)
LCFYHVVPQLHTVINPATEQPLFNLQMGTKDDVNVAVQAAHNAFNTFSQTTRAQRMTLLERLCVEYEKRLSELGQAISDEMGAPLKFAVDVQVGFLLYNRLMS